MIIGETHHAEYRDILDFWINNLSEMKNDPWECLGRLFTHCKQGFLLPCLFESDYIVLFVCQVSTDCFPSKTWNMFTSQVGKKKLLQKHISKVKTSWREKWTPSSQCLQMSSSKSERMISPCLPHLSTSRFFCAQTAELDPLTNLPVRYRRHSVAHQVLEVVVENTLGLQPPCYATYLHKGSTIPLFLLKRIVASTYRHRGSKMPPPLNNILNRIDIHRYTYISYMFFWHWHLGIHNSHTTLGRADFRSQHFFNLLQSRRHWRQDSYLSLCSN